MNAKRAYLLAAGKGSRAGGPKAWQDREGRTLLERQLEFLLGLFPPEAISVSVQAAWKERCAALDPRVSWVPVGDEAAPLGALMALLKARPLAGWGFVHHVDMPVWERGLFEALDRRIPEAEKASADAVVPVHGGRKGHPVLLSPGTQSLLLSLEPGRDRLDFWLRGRKVFPVEVPYSCIQENWNQPADLKA